MLPIEAMNKTVGFCGQYVTISCNCSDATELIDFLCSDLPEDKTAPARATYDLIIDNEDSMMSFRQEDKQLYRGKCKHSLAYEVINEIIYQCVTDNNVGHAIHAAAIHSEGGGILIPGNSGTGKSTFVTWLTACGCNYLTDELVLVAEEDYRIYPFTRPISIKQGSAAAISSFVEVDNNGVLWADSGFMIPHRLVNAEFLPARPPLSLILFPQYKAGAAIELTRLTPGKSCSRLLECYVNARNIQGHGISQIAAMTRDIPAYQLTYSSFDGLQDILADSLPLFHEQKKLS